MGKLMGALCPWHVACEGFMRFITLYNVFQSCDWTLCGWVSQMYKSLGISLIALFRIINNDIQIGLGYNMHLNPLIFHDDDLWLNALT